MCVKTAIKNINRAINAIKEINRLTALIKFIHFHTVPQGVGKQACRK